MVVMLNLVLVVFPVPWVVRVVRVVSFRVEGLRLISRDSRTQGPFLDFLHHLNLTAPCHLSTRLIGRVEIRVLG